MSALELRYEDTKRALNSLRDILQEKFSVIVRDAAIQRFEYTVEAFCLPALSGAGGEILAELSKRI